MPEGAILRPRSFAFSRLQAMPPAAAVLRRRLAEAAKCDSKIGVPTSKMGRAITAF